ncbi:hypothetical protein MMC13_006627 [Lambiella insularis]|nr:hypothetical protein [Lambiella insularis]
MNTGGLLYGYNQGVFSGVLTRSNFQDHMGVYTSDQTKKGWLTSILELGAWFGTLMAGFLAESISRKYAILVHSGVFITGVIIQCTATTAFGSSSILAEIGLDQLLRSGDLAEKDISGVAEKPGRTNSDEINE